MRRIQRRQVAGLGVQGVVGKVRRHSDLADLGRQASDRRQQRQHQAAIPDNRLGRLSLVAPSTCTGDGEPKYQAINIGCDG